MADQGFTEKFINENNQLRPEKYEFASETNKFGPHVDPDG